MEGKSAPHVKFLSAAAEAKLSFPGLNTAGFITAQVHAQAPPLLPCKLDKPLKQIISSSLEKHLVLSDEKPRPPSAGSNHRFFFFSPISLLFLLSENLIILPVILISL